MTPKSFFRSMGLEYVGVQDVGGGRGVYLFNFGDHTLAVREATKEAVIRRLEEHIEDFEKVLAGVR